VVETQRDPLRGRRVLVVEDEYMIADDLARALEDRGADVIGPAGTIEDALELLDADRQIDGAVLDINLRGERALPLADALAPVGSPSCSRPATTPGRSRTPTPPCRVCKNRSIPACLAACCQKPDWLCRIAWHSLARLQRCPRRSPLLLRD